MLTQEIGKVLVCNLSESVPQSISKQPRLMKDKPLILWHGPWLVGLAVATWQFWTDIPRINYLSIPMCCPIDMSEWVQNLSSEKVLNRGVSPKSRSTNTVSAEYCKSVLVHDIGSFHLPLGYREGGSFSLDVASFDGIVESIVTFIVRKSGR